MDNHNVIHQLQTTFRQISEQISLKPLNKESLQDAIMNYKYLLNYCCRNEAVRERCLTEEQDNKFKEDLQREIKIFQDRNGMKVEVRTPEPTFKERCNLQLKQCEFAINSSHQMHIFVFVVKENPTVRTLYENADVFPLEKEDPKEDTLMKKKFLEDLAQEIKNFKSENPAVELKMREPAERMCFGLEA
uniref:Uncharacterized protein n=1 Tax=Romanomermis culicivorax TaxID=13658 RepID=A0A915JSH9_ROMCU